ncbi:MAG: esterase [Flavobacteriaceae bacterium]|nr:esterase [Flavobacteriaceae bacterium]
MNTEQKEISYISKNSYDTLNILSKKTKNVWLVFHGIGYLSKYFLRYFKDLDPVENYIIAPQAPSKYYLGSKYKHVGASWLTRVDTIQETENLFRYVDAILDNEALPEKTNLIVLGYSQGVSVACRFVAARKLKCRHLVLMSGGIPKELLPADFEFLKDKTKVSLVYGTQDTHFDENSIRHEKDRFCTLFGDFSEIIPFEGKHEVKKELLSHWV